MYMHIHSVCSVSQHCLLFVIVYFLFFLFVLFCFCFYVLYGLYVCLDICWRLEAVCYANNYGRNAGVGCAKVNMASYVQSNMYCSTHCIFYCWAIKMKNLCLVTCSVKERKKPRERQEGLWLWWLTWQVVWKWQFFLSVFKCGLPSNILWYCPIGVSLYVNSTSRLLWPNLSRFSVLLR